MKRILFVLLVLAMLIVAVAPVLAGPPTFGFLYLNDEVVRTVIPTAAMPNAGVDPIYPIQGGVEGQLPVAGVGPGEPGYHGGKWAVNVVTWNTTPYLLTSADDVLDAEAVGDVTITRMPGADFKCPIQP